MMLKIDKTTNYEHKSARRISSELAPASGYADWARIANKAEDFILFGRQNKLITEKMVEHIRARLEARKPESPHTVRTERPFPATENIERKP